MPKPIVFIAALLLALPAFAQTRMPAHQVEADTNMVNIAVSLPFTAQVALDWIDANWPAFSSESWSNLDPAEDTVQSVFDWVDDNWQAVDDSGWLFLDPESPTTQATFDWLDGWASGVGTGPFISGTNIAGATYNETNLTWEGLGNMPGTNIENAVYNETNLTWEGLGNMPGTNIAGFTYSTSTMAWTDITLSNSVTAYKTTAQVDASYVPCEWGAITNYDSVINGNSALFNLASGCFSPAVSGLYAVAASVRKQNTFLIGYDDDNEFAFGVATSPSGGIWAQFFSDTEEGDTVGSGATLISVTNTSVDIYLTFWAATNLTSSNAIRRARFDVWLVAPY